MQPSFLLFFDITRQNKCIFDVFQSSIVSLNKHILSDSYVALFNQLTQIHIQRGTQFFQRIQIRGTITIFNLHNRIS